MADCFMCAYREWKIQSLKKVVRTLMMQVREEEQLRKDCLTGTISHEQIPEVTDEDVERRIKEILSE